MKTRLDLGNGIVALVVLTDKTRDRLLPLHFKSCISGMRTAGMFFNQVTPSGVLENPKVKDELAAHVREIWRGENPQDTFSIEVHFEDTIAGWSSTADIRNFKEKDLEWFCPNNHSRALRVKLSSRHIFAPVTKTMTLVFELKSERNAPTIMVRSMYPGRDVGKLDGDITEREGLVFFDWDHQGEPLPVELRPVTNLL